MTTPTSVQLDLFDGVGARISRVRSAGLGAASGIVLAPAVAIASKYVVD